MMLAPNPNSGGLVLDQVSKIYGRNLPGAIPAVKTMSLDVQRGEIVALLGSSGCGKTSTLRMIAGFESVTEGRITLAGHRIDTLPPSRRGVAMAFEGYALYPPLTIAQNIGFGLARDRGIDTAQRVREVAEMLEIGPILKRKPAGLSGGQQQRASLARALARDADLHLLDEPMGQLEPQLRSVLRGRVKSLVNARGLTAVLVTHDQTEANAMADRIAVMEAGVLQQFGAPETLRERPVNLFVATFLGEPPMNALPAVTTATGVQLQNDAALRFALPGARLPAPGLKVVLGVRPHRVTLGGGDWQGTVVSNQWLGDQAHLAMTVAGQVVVAVSHHRVPAAIGSTLAFGFAPEASHLFDAASGKALLHGIAPA